MSKQSSPFQFVKRIRREPSSPPAPQLPVKKAELTLTAEPGVVSELANVSEQQQAEVRQRDKSDNNSIQGEPTTTREVERDTHRGRQRDRDRQRGRGTDRDQEQATEPDRATPSTPPSDLASAHEPPTQPSLQRYPATVKAGVHTFQNMYGCEWDDVTGATGGFDQLGYDGKDFLTYDLKNQRFIAPAQQAFITVQKWNHNPAQLEFYKQYYTQECVDSLKKYVSYGRSALERTVAPEASLLQKDSSSPGFTCHVTGFYPRGIIVTWQRNGEDLHEDVELGETLPNGDGTFQTRSHLTVKPEDWKSQKYTCTVQHKSLEEDIVLSINNGSSPPIGIIIGCVLGALILILAVIGVVIWKKKSSGYKTTNTSDTGSEGSDQPAVKA